MKDIESVKKELMASKKSAELAKFAKSPEAARISKAVDGAALKKAAMAGDQETLGNILKQVLSTPDGQALAKKIGETFGQK